MRKTILLAVMIAIQCLAGCEADKKTQLVVEIEKLAQQGNPDAEYHLGMFYNNGLGVKQDPAQAFVWFNKAADAGNPLGAYKVGCYYAGQFGVVNPDPEKSLEYKLVAANAGYSMAQVDVGNTYFRKDNFTEAIKWWQSAAGQGNRQALGNLSFAYYEGKLVPQNKVLWYAYYKLANRDQDGNINSSAQKGFVEIEKNMSENEIKQAEQVVLDWKPNPTPTTLNAESGMDDAIQLVSNTKINP